MDTKRTLVSLCTMLLLMFGWIGCGGPQLKPQNLQLSAALRTAISARNVEWLEKNEAIVEQRYADGMMSEAEYEAFRSIIDKAKQGQWEAAEQETLALQKAQRPVRK